VIEIAFPINGGPAAIDSVPLALRRIQSSAEGHAAFRAISADTRRFAKVDARIMR